MTTPEFSIVTIALNNLKGLQRTTSSVLSQQLEDFEYIVVDGGSSDGTRDWLQGIRDPRLHWSSEIDGGIYQAMNRGIEQASGKYTMVINSGDALSEPTTLQRIREHFDTTDAHWGYGAVRLIGKHGEAKGAYTFDPYDRQRFVMGFNWIPHASVCVRQDLLAELGSYRTDLGTMADQEYLLRAALMSEPTVISWFICDYELGGVSQETGPRSRELFWHRIRLEAGAQWRSPLADRLAAEMLATRKPLRIWLKRAAGKFDR